MKHLIHKRADGENTRKLIRDMVSCLRDKYAFDVNESGYCVLFNQETIVIMPLEQGYYRQYDVDLFMTGLELLGFVVLPSLQHLKPYEKDNTPKQATIRPY